MNSLLRQINLFYITSIENGHDLSPEVIRLIKLEYNFHSVYVYTIPEYTGMLIGIYK